MKAFAVIVSSLLVLSSCNSSRPTRPVQMVPVELPTAPATVAPDTEAPVLPAETAQAPTIASSTKPSEITDFDRQAVEAAAKGWWEEFYTMFENLPQFDPKPLLRRASPDAVGVLKFATVVEQLAKGGYRAKPPSVKQIRVLSINFSDNNTASARTCTADDVSAIQPNSGDSQGEGVQRARNQLTMVRTPTGWLIRSIIDVGAVESGLTCDDPF